MHLDRVLQTIEVLNEQLDAMDEELLVVVEQDPVCQRLMTVPGVGPVIAIRFMAVVDQPERFHSAHHLMSYIGLTPGDNSSSLRAQKHTAITKAGANDLRTALIQGAWSIMRVQNNDPMAKWATTLAQRRNRFVAVTALARKLAGVLWAIWTKGTTYQSTLAAARADSEVEVM